ncbi:MAG: hypothetical protein KME19_24150 [Microcoleus vaginatus WJT46-NPBG5]|jgi:hypothetical protein|nr:hypothetical protein [Microcoleus vaginatus WJT46-NPBG5]
MKTRNQNVETSNGTPESKRRGSSLNSFLAGAASVLVLLLAGGAFLLYRAMQTGRVNEPVSPAVNNRVEIASPPPILATPVPPSAGNTVGLQPGQFAVAAFGDKARVELLSVQRVPGKPEEVRIAMRVERLADEAAGEIIDVGATSARNSDTFDTYQAVDPLNRSSGMISLFELRRGQPVEGYAVLNVPPTVKAIDVVIENVGVFKKVPVAPAGQGTNPQNSSLVNPSVGTSTTAISPLPKPPVGVAGKTPAAQSTTAATPSPSPTAVAPQAGAEMKPGEFVQQAYGSKGEVELLSVKRIQDPETGNRDVVNVQMRIRRNADQVAAMDIIGVGETAARNPQTTESYKAIDMVDHSTGSVSLSQLRPNASADAYVWLRVPETVKSLDIFVPETAAFKNVPISN